MDGFTQVGTMEALEARNRKLLNITIEGRVVTVFKYKEKLYCMDTNCYHAGGALSLGPIEEVNGTPCISCPIHHYKLSLIDGRQASYTYDVVDDEVGPCYLVFPEGDKPKQRVHEVFARDGLIYVRLNLDSKVHSDRLAFKPELLRHAGDRVHITIGEAPQPKDVEPVQPLYVNKPTAQQQAQQAPQQETRPRRNTLPMNEDSGVGMLDDDDLLD